MARSGREAEEAREAAAELMLQRLLTLGPPFFKKGLCAGRMSPK
jgi:hypothetical protein